MAFPSIVGAAVESSTNTAGTSHVINLPSLAADNLCLIFINKGNGITPSFNALAGWTELTDNPGPNEVTILYRQADGSEGATITLTSSETTRSAAIAYEISGAANPATQAPELSSRTTGTSTTPSSGSVSPSAGAKDYLWFSVFGCAGEEADDNTWCNSPPANYSPSPPDQKTCGTAGTNLGGIIAVAYRQNNTGTEGPGTFNMDASLAWVAWTVVVHPAPPAITVTMGSTLRETSISLAVDITPPPAFVMSASSFITASGENTTAQLTAPAGKTTADFGGGRIQDDENPGDAVDLAANDYREDEWCIQATAFAETGEQYEFRVVLSDGTPLDTYTVTPKWTIASPAVTITIQALLDEVTAALSVSHGQQLTVVSTLDEVMASLNVSQGQAVTLQSLLDELQASLNVSHGQQLTIVSTLDEVQASLAVTMQPALTIQTTLDELAASLNVEQGSAAISITSITPLLDEVSAALNVSHGQALTIVSSLDEVTASLNVGQAHLMTVQSTLDEVQASLSIQQPFTLTIGTTIDEVMASLNMVSGYQINIVSVLDKVFASLNVNHGQQLTIASTLDEVFASLSISHGQTVTVATILRELKASLNVFSGNELTIATTLDEVFASLNVGQAQLVTLSPVLRELLASLQISHGQRMTIVSTLDEVQASLNLGQVQELLIAVLLDELTAVLNVESGAHVPVAGTFVQALRERTLHFVRPRDPLPTRYDREGLMRLRPR